MATETVTWFVVMWIGGVYGGAAPLTSMPRGTCEELAAHLTMRGLEARPMRTFTCERGLKTRGGVSGRS